MEEKQEEVNKEEEKLEEAVEKHWDEVDTVEEEPENVSDEENYLTEGTEKKQKLQDITVRMFVRRMKRPF